MKQNIYLINMCLLSLLLLLAPVKSAAVTPTETITIGDMYLDNYVSGATLGNAPDYDWWYGCAPTSAGMMMGYYDFNGYNTYRYDNLLPGATAELSSFSNPGASVNSIIASSGHITDFYSAGYMGSGDDLSSPWHEFDSLADFMGTSQDSVGQSNGSTGFWFFDDGSPIYVSNLYGFTHPSTGNPLKDYSGMFGLWEYFDYAGYGSQDASTDMNIFNQYTDNMGLTYGFSFADYMAEIDSGRVVMLHVEGHSMFGYGYDETSQMVYLHDTWSEGEQSMLWGGSYSGLDMFGVTTFTPTGGAAVAIPGAVWLLGSGLIGLVGIRRRFN